MTTRFPIRCTTLLLTACLVLAAAPALAAPATTAPRAAAGTTPAPGLSSALGAVLHELWTDLVAPIDRLFEANGKKSDAPGDDEPIVEPLLGGKIDPNGRLDA